MIVRAVIIRNDKLLMVYHKTQSGKVVWNYPGGNVEDGETFEEAVIREVKEETGFDVRINKLLHVKTDKRMVYLCSLENQEDSILEVDDEDILEIRWVSMDEEEYFDDVTREVLDLLKQ